MIQKRFLVVFGLMIASASISLAQPAAAPNIISDDEFEAVRTLLTGDLDIAKYKALQIRGRTEAEARDAAKSSVVIADLNNDGKRDVALVAETEPKFMDPSEKPCPAYDLASLCDIRTERSLFIFFADANGSFDRRPVISSTQVVMNSHEGGIKGDPLEKLMVNSRGSLMIRLSAGSSDLWEGTFTFGYRDGDFYLLGRTRRYRSNTTLKELRLDENLITGDVEIYRDANYEDENPGPTERFKVPTTARIRLRDFNKSRDLTTSLSEADLPKAPRR